MEGFKTIKTTKWERYGFNLMVYLLPQNQKILQSKTKQQW
jgi:hypothetical protein